MILIESRRLSDATLQKRHGGMTILDVTSKGPQPWVRFSPFFPHGGIPVPFSDGTTAQSVEGIWQGLKVFEKAGVDQGKMQVTSMKGIKRSARTFGRVLGHRRGVSGDELLPYLEARKLIYLPSYRWILENRLADEVAQIRKLLLGDGVVLLDYETNVDLNDLKKPLSHAGLIKRFIENDWPA